MLIHMTTEPEQQSGVGVPDAFQRLWTPHRMAYIKGENKPTGPAAGDGCPFCSIPAMSDEDGLILRRAEHAYAVLNLYPYNSGHLMAVPYRHVADYTELTPEETADVAELTKQAMTALRAASGAHGFNIGLNQGDVAGAGIAAHLHQHVGRGHQLHAGHRPHPGAAATPGGHPEDARRRLAGGRGPVGRFRIGFSCSASGGGRC
jgi:ATP adenylyltransferase